MAYALLLNGTWEPIAVVSLKRAICLVVTDKAEIISHSELEARSAHLTIPIPTVIRLKRYIKIPYRATVPLNRRALLTRDKGKCAYCHKQNANTIDHVVPRARGGLHRWENVVAACSRCNSKKDDKTLAELGWELDFVPRAPSGTFWLILGVKEVSEDWAPYLAYA